MLLFDDFFHPTLGTGLLCGELSVPQRDTELCQIRRQLGAEYHLLPRRRMYDGE